MERSRRTFVALGLLIAAVLSAVTVARFLARSPDDALRPDAPPISSIRTGGPPAPSAEMESGLTAEVTPDRRDIRPRARAREEPRLRVRSTLRPQPLPVPRNQAPATQVPATRIPAPRVPAPRDAPGGQGTAAPTGPAAPGVEAPPADALTDPAAAAPQVAPAPVPALPPAPASAATPHPVPVLTPPVPVTLNPPRHPDAWRVVVESPGLVAEVRPEGLTARVRLRLRVRDDGAVERVEIAVPSGRPELDAAAAGAAKAWRFLPARRDGVAIASAVLIWVAFVIGP